MTSRTLLAVLSLVWLPRAAAETRAGHGEQRTVLLLKSYSSIFGPQNELVEKLKRQLAAGEPAPLVLEFNLGMDQSNESVRAAQAAVDYLTATFEERRPDLVLTVGLPAQQFVRANADDLFPSVPLLTAGVERLLGGGQSPAAREVPVEFTVDPREVVALARALRPSLRRIQLVTGEGANEQRVREVLKQVLPKLVPDLEVMFTQGESAEAVKTRLSRLGDGDIVVYTSFIKDAAGNTYPFDSALPGMVAASGAPLLAVHREKLGTGVLGVVAWSVDAVATESVRRAQALMEGAPAASLRGPPLMQLDRAVDVRALERWNIPAGALPAGVEHAFARDRDWYWWALGAGTVGVAEATLILLLLLNRRARLRSEREAQYLSQALLKSQEAERARIARELHDDLAQRVARVGMLALRDGRDEADQQELVRELTSIGVGMQEVAYGLHPSTLTTLGVGGSVEAECARLERASGIPVRLGQAGLGGGEGIHRDVSLCAFRVVQESLRNALRHGKPKAIHVVLTRRDGGLQLSVRDDGAGFDARNPSRLGLGLLSMRERVRELKGEIDVDSAPGEGTEITAWIPLAQGNREEST